MSEMIPFQIETKRVLELLAKQIYQSPLALLRENTQNAYDAIRLRAHRDSSFKPRIDITINDEGVRIVDNGIGMTADDLRQHYWRAGSSSKNTPEARAAGVVGTFGIGAMANFGIADELVIETQSAVSGARTKSRALLEKLSVQENCIEIESTPPANEAGTAIFARIRAEHRIAPQVASQYIGEFVSLLEIPVYVNGQLISQQPAEKLVPQLAPAWEFNGVSVKIGNRLSADLNLKGSAVGEMRMELLNIAWSGQALAGRIVLRSGTTHLRTARSGFGLATTSVSSHYQFGGVVDLRILEPTAGREALTTEGMQLLQSMMTEIDAFASTTLAAHDACDSSTPFMNWVTSHGRFDLCAKLKTTLSPESRVSLAEVSLRSQKAPVLVYEGASADVVKVYATEDSPVLTFARQQPRRRCEMEYISQYCKSTAISDKPVVLSRKSILEQSDSEAALAFRLSSILESDYFLKTRIEYGKVLHNLPILVEREGERISILLDPDGQSVALIVGLYKQDFTAFISMAKDFVRSVIFEKVRDFVPSSTRQGADAFLKLIRRPRELFEYEDSDLSTLSSILADFRDGKISMLQVVERSRSTMRSSVQVVDSGASGQIQDLIPDVVQNELTLTAENGSEQTAESSPSIMRTEVASSGRRVLTIDSNEPALRGYRCFLALTDRAREEIGEFFLQPHRTAIVWGGQKVLCIFLHHAERYGLYYDLQMTTPIPAGGGSCSTSTIMLKDAIFIPIPTPLQGAFIPAPGERKRFEVKWDLLRTESE